VPLLGCAILKAGESRECKQKEIYKGKDAMRIFIELLVLVRLYNLRAI
jgi:hypothetical protein